MPRFIPTSETPDQLAASIVALSELTTTLAIEVAMEAGRADAYGGRRETVVQQAERLALGTEVAAGELAWLIAELRNTDLDGDQRAEAAIAIAGLRYTLVSVAQAFAEVGQRRDCDRVRLSAGALRTAAAELEDLLPAVQPTV
jgi:hypothetical protein